MITEQEASKERIGPFCRERGISEGSFYYWRSRLRKNAPVRFAVIEAAPRLASQRAWVLELVLQNGERLRISDKVDAAALQVVLKVVRG